MEEPSFYEENRIVYENSELAGINFNQHFIVAGLDERLNRIESFLKEQEKAFQRLWVTHAFHSRWIDQARRLYLEYLNNHEFKGLEVELISCMDAQKVREMPETYLWDVIRRPMRVSETIQKLEGAGPCVYIDLSPTGTLATFVKYNLGAKSRSEVHALMTAYGSRMDKIEALRGGIC